MYENWKVAQVKLHTPSPPDGSESWEAEHPESEEDPVWLYPGDTGWHEAAPIFVIGYRDEETDEDDIREMEAFFDDDEVRANEELYDATD